MQSNQAEFKGNTLIIKSKKSPILIRATFIIVIFICVIIPLIVSYYLIEERKGPHFGIFLSFIFFWGIGFYLMRILLWNSYGKEVLIFGKENVLYEADYRFFKDGKKSISSNSLNIEAIPIIEGKMTLATLLLSDSEKKIETVLAIPFEKMQLLIQEIDNRE